MIKQIIAGLVTVLIICTLAIPVMGSIPSDDLDVIVLTGQSNAAYWDASTSYVNSNGIPSSNVFYYGTDDGPINCGTVLDMDYDTTFNSYSAHSMLNSDRTSWKVGSIDGAIAQTVADKTNASVYVINAGIGGAGITFLRPQETGGAYVADLLADAMKKAPSGYSINKVGFVWIQGESNSTMAVSTYISCFNQIQAWYESVGFNKCYMVETTPSIGGNATTAQIQIINTDPDVYLGSSAPLNFSIDNGMLRGDGFHYTHAAREIVGVDVGLAIASENPGANNMIISVIPIILMIIPIMIFVRLIVTKED